MDKPHILICSSAKAVRIAEGAKQNLERNLLVSIWTEDFFNDSEIRLFTLRGANMHACAIAASESNFLQTYAPVKHFTASNPQK
jgi:hypothetical protein